MKIKNLSSLLTLLTITIKYVQNFTFYNIAILSACYEQQNRTEENFLAQKSWEMYHNRTEWMWSVGLRNGIKRFRGENSLLYWPYRMEYNTFDVCNDFDNLTTAIATLALHKKYAFNIGVIFAYMPTTMMELLKTSMSYLPILEHQWGLIKR